ncbi:polysaccharide deacetylase family protein [Treponema parvum]|uniref:polysaccharide deacetylase family protein n=1 Tax=Treponema parvum TaxID=138851 RepID=UPI001AEBAC65|nr:polysaccharide deacetylase family protein [Treponema parvum]QTQ15767.1 polysaccharide deacetylase family protein [Treponema parvum]
MKGRRRFLVFLIWILSFRCFAGVVFDNPDLNKDDELLFTVENKAAGTYPYRTAFRTRLENEAPSKSYEILTCYPEKMELLSENSILRIRNRCGTALYSFASSSLVYSEKADSDAFFLPCPAPVSVSPDGRWSCFIRRKGFVSGELVLQNTESGRSVILSDSAEFSYDEVPVKWSLDSSIVLYERGDSVCFADPDAALKQIQIDEKFRTVVKGNINSVSFTRGRQLVYVDGDIVYCLRTGELHTAGLYSSYVGIGTAVARLPETYMPGRDRFFVNDDVTRFVVIKNNKSVSYYSIKADRFSYVNVEYTGSLLKNSATVLGAAVIWPEGKKSLPVLQLELLSLAENERSFKIYTFDGVSGALREVLSLENPSCFAVNPSGNRAAYYSGGFVCVFDTSNWKRTAVMPSEHVVCALWKDNGTLILGGKETVRLWNVLEKAAAENDPGKTCKTLFLSSAEKVLWNSEANTVQAKTSAAVYSYDEQKKVWKQDISHPFPDKSIVQNGRFRVYVADAKNGKYENALYLRSLAGKAYTFPLIEESVQNVPPPKKVSVVFDALDCADGLPEILSALRTRSVNATFFINGEFIRRYPDETLQIAKSGFECASMFHTASDLTEKRFVVDEDFIRKGLARNEDDFYACTGKELTLFWHAPFFKSDAAIRLTGLKAGYTYVDVPGGNRDGVVFEQFSDLYKSAAQLIDYYMSELASGGASASIIPVSVGILHGTRGDYLYEKLGLLINLLFDYGYELVPVSALGL